MRQWHLATLCDVSSPILDAVHAHVPRPLMRLQSAKWFGASRWLAGKVAMATDASTGNNIATVRASGQQRTRSGGFVQTVLQEPSLRTQLALGEASTMMQITHFFFQNLSLLHPSACTFPNVTKQAICRTACAA